MPFPAPTTSPMRATTSDHSLAVAEALSPREMDVLALVAEGCRDREIAARLYVSHHTVANHVKSILSKLGVSSRAAAVACAARSGLL